jgi:exosortase C (VPDSG-CTERM-specific)
MQLLEMDQTQPATARKSIRRWSFVAGAVLLTLLFARPLYDWARLAMSVDLHSHILLMPLISGYLVWNKRGELPRGYKGTGWMAVPCAAMALSLLWVAWRWGGEWELQDYVAVTIGAYVLMLIGLGFACFEWETMRAVAFPAFMLIFMVPIPSGLEIALERFLQHFSADASHLLFWMFGETYLRDGQLFLLPGLSIRVAQECSGIRSSVVLFILSLLAAHMMLRSKWHRAILVLAVVPLGIVRNGVRVYVITALTLHVNPGIIDSPLHHRGGPLFFALSLIPFFALLWYLRRREKRSAPSMSESPA